MPGDEPFLPYGRQLIEEDDIDAVSAVLRGDFLTTGPTVAAFEEAFARKVGARYAVACSSGTAGLHLAAMALGLGEGDRVVVPTVTFLATANAARYVGAEVIFADVDPQTGLMTPETLAAAIHQGGDGVRAVIPVHLGGQCDALEEIHRMAAEHGLDVIEDACQAVGTTYAGADGDTELVGACRHSSMAVFSCHPVKTVAMGEGGVITTNDETLRSRLLSLRNHGIANDAAAFHNTDLGFDAGGGANPWYYEMPGIGYNYRASDIHCALGLSQLAKLDRFVTRRRALAARYDRLLEPLAPLVRPVTRVPGVKAAWHLYGVLIDFAAAALTRKAVMEALRRAGIGTQVHFIPVHEQPYYRRRYGHRHLPGASAYYASALSLPLHPSMTDADVERVVTVLDAALRVDAPRAADGALVRTGAG